MADDTTELLKKYAKGIKDVSALSERYTQIQAAQTAGDKALAASLTKTASATDKVALEMLKLNAGLDATTRSSDAAKKAMSELGERGKEAAAKASAGEWRNLEDSIGKVAKVGAIGAVAIGAIGAAMIGAAAHAADWNEELKKVNLAIASGPLEKASASIGTIGTSFKAAAVTLVGEFSPQITEAGTRVTALGLAAVDAFNNLGSGEKVMDRIATFASQILTSAFTSPIRAVLALGDAMGTSYIPGFAAIERSLSEWEDDNVVDVTAALKQMGSDALEPLVAVTGDYMGRARELVTRQTAVNQAARQGAKDQQQLAEEMRRTAVAAEAFTVKGAALAFTTSAATVKAAKEQAEKTAKSTSDSLIAIGKTVAAAGEEQRKRDEADAKARIELQKQVKKSYIDSIGSISASATQISDLLSGRLAETTSSIDGLQKDLEKSTSETEKKQLKTKIDALKAQEAAQLKAATIAFRIQQATGVVGVAISTAQAIMMALGTLPPPASYVAAGAAALAGVAQVATIMMQAPPTSSGATASMPSAPSAPSSSSSSRAAGRSGGSGGSAYAASGSGVSSGSMLPSAETVGPSYRSAETNMPVVEVSDARVGAGAGSMTLRTTPGDHVDVYRKGLGAEGRDRGVMQKLDQVCEELRALRQDIHALVDAIMYQNHRSAAGGPIGRK